MVFEDNVGMVLIRRRRRFLLPPAQSAINDQRVVYNGQVLLLAGDRDKKIYLVWMQLGGGTAFKAQKSVGSV